MYGKGTGIESFAKTVKQILAVTQSGKDQATLVSSLFNVWEENILSLGEGMQEEVGKKKNYLQKDKEVGSIVLVEHRLANWDPVFRIRESQLTDCCLTPT